MSATTDGVVKFDGFSLLRGSGLKFSKLLSLRIDNMFSLLRGSGLKYNGDKSCVELAVGSPSYEGVD